jgi:hypothetical protein
MIDQLNQKLKIFKMKKMKQAGIWMDHSFACIMELINDAIVQNTVVSEFTHEEKKIMLGRNEKLMHKKEQHLQSGYYRKLGDTIRDYSEVVLFGPTDAKNELFNLLKTDHLFEDIKIEVKHADKMTENQMHAFVREYFTQ